MLEPCDPLEACGKVVGATKNAFRNELFFEISKRLEILGISFWSPAARRAKPVNRFWPELSLTGFLPYGSG